MDILLIDLSSIAHPLWHMSSADPDPNATSTKIVARVRALASNHPSAAVCCDAGRSFRKDIAPSYKANRPESEAPLHHQIRLAIEILTNDGFPVWSAPGFEADDLIATATAKALEIEDASVVIASADKDLLQLVGPRVRAVLPKDGTSIDADGVFAKFGVHPLQMRDFLCMVGDASDNVKGIKNVGPKTAAKLLEQFGSLDALYQDLREVGPAQLRLTPGLVTALNEFKPEWPTTVELITLRMDVEIPFNEVLQARVPRDVDMFTVDEGDEQMEPEIEQPAATDGAEAVQVESAPQALTVRAPDVLAPPPAEWERQLEPRSMREVQQLSEHVFKSRLFSAYGSPQAVLTTLIAGRELGLQAMASLRALHIIEGRPTLAADLIRAMVIRSGAAKYFRCTERTAERATFETQRGDDPPFSLTYTIEEAVVAGVVKPKSGWVANPADMLVARSSVKLARLVYPDVCHGLLTPEEMYESRDAKGAVA